MAKQNPKSLKNLKPPFAKGQSGNPNGRPKKILTIMKESGYTKADALHVFKEIGWKNKKQIEELLKNDKNPLIVQLIARTFVKALNSADYRIVKEIMEYVIGTPQQHVKVEHEGSVDIKQSMIIDGKEYKF